MKFLLFMLFVEMCFLCKLLIVLTSVISLEEGLKDTMKNIIVGYSSDSTVLETNQVFWCLVLHWQNESMQDRISTHILQFDKDYGRKHKLELALIQFLGIQYKVQTMHVFVTCNVM